jgi:hypothetical protein
VVWARPVPRSSARARSGRARRVDVSSVRTRIRIRKLVAAPSGRGFAHRPPPRRVSVLCKSGSFRAPAPTEIRRESYSGRQVRGVLGIVLFVVIGTIGLIAALDAFRSSPGPATAPGTTTEIRETTTSTLKPAPTWPGTLRRTVRLGRAPGTSWDSFWTLEPGAYELRARFDVPDDADLDIWFESTTGSDTVDLLGRTRPRDCVMKHGRDICRAALDFSLPNAGGA